MRVIDSRPVISHNHAWDALEFVYNPAKEPPKAVAGVKKPVTATKVDKKEKVRPTCKQRPDSRRASARGAGNSRPFVPWCK